MRDSSSATLRDGTRIGGDTYRGSRTTHRASEQGSGVRYGESGKRCTSGAEEVLALNLCFSYLKQAEGMTIISDGRLFVRVRANGSFGPGTGLV